MLLKLCCVISQLVSVNFTYQSVLHSIFMIHAKDKSHNIGSLPTVCSACFSVMIAGSQARS